MKEAEDHACQTRGCLEVPSMRKSATATLPVSSELASSAPPGSTCVHGGSSAQIVSPNNRSTRVYWAAQAYASTMRAMSAAEDYSIPLPTQAPVSLFVHSH